MKKKLNFVICLILSVLCALSASACGMYDDEEVIVDSTKTQLYVGLVPSGYGNSWLISAISRFEKKYSDYEFEPGSGKKGVQVIIDDVSYGNVIASSLPGARYQVIYTSDVNYGDLISKKLIYDMTDIINEKFDDSDENGNAIKTSIADKFMSEDQKNCFISDGKIYALPFVAGDDAISYDRDLFEEKGYFFLASDPDNGDYHAYYETEGEDKVYTLGKLTDGTLSMGRDGVAGTFDDGLPATYEQFYFLMKTMVADGISPITWSGMYPSYLTQMLYAIWANNEGVTNMKMNYTLRGTATDLIDTINDDGTYTLLPSTEINDDNGYLLHNQVGKYQALDFLYNIIKIMKENDAAGYNMAFKESVDHLTSQDNFLQSVVRSQNDSKNYKRIAMFHDGCYWENEASSTFISMGEGYGKTERKIGWMSYPHPTVEGAGNGVFVGSGSAMMFMNANIDDAHIDVAKKFVQFMHTRESLVEFTTMTSMIRPFKFNMKAEEKAKMSYFGQCLFDRFSTVDYLDPMSNNPVYTTNYSLFSIISSNNWRTSDADLGNTDIPSNALKTFTAVKYFKGMQNYYTQSYWNTSVLKK